MVSEIIYFVTFALVGIGLVTLVLGLSKLLQTRKPNEIKLSTYESGIAVTGDPRIQYKMRYYVFGLLLVLFDVEMIFLFPWAVVFKSLGLFAFVEMLVFIAIILLGLFYAWRKGALKWV
ncbi:MAG: NADH-quinone oxidoreductase subunit A [Actinobacteria bacterium]|nr:NADH-quinone oxidoreductase subunit A [Actinomycetota bacterium]